MRRAVAFTLRGSVLALRGGALALRDALALGWHAAALRCFGLVLVLWAVLLGAWPATAYAQTEPALRVLILEGPSAEWLRRVRGQLSDLSVTILTLPLVVEGQAEADLLRQLRPLAANRDAALVAWLITDGARYDTGASEDTHVAIWFARSGRLFTRRLGASWQRLSRADRSGVLEIGALSVRSAARSLLLDPNQTEALIAPDGSLAGAADPALAAAAAQGRAAAQSAARSAEHVARREANAPPPGSASDSSRAGAASAGESESTDAAGAAETPGVESNTAPLDGQPLPEALVPDEGQPQTGARVESRALGSSAAPPSDDGSAGSAPDVTALPLLWSAELGFSGQLAGPPGYAALGVAGGVRAASGRWSLGLLGRFGLPLRSELGPSELTLQHHALLAEAQYLGWRWAALELGPLVRGGLALSRRETVSGPAALEASGASWNRAVQLGAGALAQYRWGTHWGASLRGVLHWLPARTDYSLVDAANVPIATARPWAVQPSLELNASWHW